MKKLSELTAEELKKVYENNQKLQNTIFDALTEDAYFWVEEYINNFKRGAINYSFSVDGYGDFLTVKNIELFVEGLSISEESFMWLPDYAEKIERLAELVNRYNEVRYTLSIDNDSRLCDRIDELTDGLRIELFNAIRMEYDNCYDTENAILYFIEFYVDERMDDSYYIDDNYILYKHVEYEKCYK